MTAAFDRFVVGVEGCARPPDRPRCRLMTARDAALARRKRVMSLEQLNTWLNTLEPAARVDGTSMLDGYLTAIVIGPRSILPDEWFVDLLGEHGHIASASGMTLAAVTAIVGRFNAISEGLSATPQTARADIREGG